MIGLGYTTETKNVGFIASCCSGNLNWARASPPRSVWDCGEGGGSGAIIDWTRKRRENQPMKNYRSNFHHSDQLSPRITMNKESHE